MAGLQTKFQGPLGRQVHSIEDSKKRFFEFQGRRKLGRHVGVGQRRQNRRFRRRRGGVDRPDRREAFAGNPESDPERKGRN